MTRFMEPTCELMPLTY